MIDIGLGDVMIYFVGQEKNTCQWIFSFIIYIITLKKRIILCLLYISCLWSSVTTH